MHKSHLLFFLTFQNIFSGNAQDFVIESLSLFFDYTIKNNGLELNPNFLKIKIELLKDNEIFWYKNAHLFAGLKLFLILQKEMDFESAAIESFLGRTFIDDQNQGEKMTTEQAVSFAKAICYQSATLNEILNTNISDDWICVNCDDPCDDSDWVSIDYELSD